MPPLPRLLATALFVVLAALTALLVAPSWQSTHPELTSANATSQPSMARAANLVPRIALALGLLGMGLAGALVISLARGSLAAVPSRSPFVVARADMGTLSKLAETSVAQGEELNRERDVRRRAEQDVQFKQHLLTLSLEEKIRLGQDLHDGIIQSLYAVGLTLESARALLQHEPAEADRRLEQCRTALNSAIRDARSYLTGLAPESLRHTNFSQALSALLEELRAGGTAGFELRVDDEAAALLSPEQTLDALQIAREAVSNALRHGGASHITVRVQKGDREVGLLVQDNGAGFDSSVRRDGGHGLRNMQARATHIGAALHIFSRPGEGARVLATIPVLQSPTA